MCEPKKIFVTRGCPGSGKSTFTKFLASCISGSVICSADHYFENEAGEYNFDASLLGAAHKACQNKFMTALGDKDCRVIIIDNTNTKPSDFKFYEDASAEVGAMVFHLVVENRHGGQNSHGVPPHVIDNMRNNLRNNIIL